MGQVARPLIALVVIVGLIAGGYFLLRDRLSGSVQDLRVGDCFDVPPGETASGIQHQPCTVAHDAEVFVVGDVQADSYPVVFGFDDWVEENCLGSAFQSYVGAAAEDRADIDVGYFSPTRDGWEGGDREITCYLTPADGGKITHSYKAGAAPAQD